MILGRDFFNSPSHTWCGLLDPTASGVIRDPEVVRAWSVWPNLTGGDWRNLTGAQIDEIFAFYSL
jgi:hypothetical protein